MDNQTIESKLLFANTVLTNASSQPAISEALAPFGYDASRLSEGKMLLEDGQALHQLQVKEYGEQYTASDALATARAEANAQYIVHVKIARVALKNDRGNWEALLLSGDRAQSMSGWLKQAKTFYANALGSDKIQEELGKFGVTAQSLEDTQILLSAVEAKIATQQKEKGEAQQATVDRDESFDKLQDWLSDFVAIVRLALQGKPQYLEMLGIVQS